MPFSSHPTPNQLPLERYQLCFANEHCRRTFWKLTEHRDLWAFSQWNQATCQSVYTCAGVFFARHTSQLECGSLRTFLRRWILLFMFGVGICCIGESEIKNCTINFRRKIRMKGRTKLLPSCPTLYDPMYCSLPGSSIHGIFQARILEWVAISFSRGSPQPRDWTRVSCIAGRSFTIWATRELNIKK